MSASRRREQACLPKPRRRQDRRRAGTDAPYRQAIRHRIRWREMQVNAVRAVPIHGAISQRRAGSGDPAYNAVGRMPSRGGICDAVYNAHECTRINGPDANPLD